MHSHGMMSKITSLLKKHGVTGVLTVIEVMGGRNNRVWQVQANGMAWIAKQYFDDPDDTRERQRTEYDFCRFMWDGGSTQVPCPLICEENMGMTLFEYIPGRKVLPGEVQFQYLLQIIDFVQAMNRQKHSRQALNLLTASESCFSISDHIQCIEARVKRLQFIREETILEREVKRFFQLTLIGCWEEHKQRVMSTVSSSALNETLNLSERCVSPSDLGFHNALLNKEGTLKFIDFEYAGWDDPAKLSCDFFCQPEVQAPIEWFDIFVKEIMSEFPDSERHKRRAKMLLPLYQIKWACILLNEFLPVDARRRDFARPKLEHEYVKREQFQKAKQMLDSLLNENIMSEAVFEGYESRGAYL